MMKPVIEQIREIVENGEEMDWEDASFYLKSLLASFDEQKAKLDVAQQNQWQFNDEVPTQGMGISNGFLMVYGSDDSLKEVRRLMDSQDRLHWFETNYRSAMGDIAKLDRENSRLLSELDQASTDIDNLERQLGYHTA